MEHSLNPSILKASFGRHETFALRYSWLTKGFQTFTKNPAIFSSDEATIDLGVRIEGQCYQILVAGDLNT
jgi:hypothetical protein